MKLTKFLLVGIVLIAFNTTQAQIKTTVTLPDWGVSGNDNARYYYIPDIESYYDVNGQQFVYMTDGKWVKSNTQPIMYKDYDLYNGYKVVITNEIEPYADFDNIKIKYAKGYKGDPQKTIKIKTRKNGAIKTKTK
jgi:hypothetical protein